MLACAAALLAACAPLRDERTERCERQIVIGYATAASAADPAVASRIADAAGVRLTPRRTIADRFIVASLEVEGPETACEAAMARLREDPRISSVEADAQRQPHVP